MPRRCTVCSHPEMEAVNTALLTGEAYRAIARRFAVSKDAVERHAKAHLAVKLVKAKEAAEVAHADGLLEQVRDLQRRAVSILDRAERAGELDTALRAIGQARACLELLGKLAGELQAGTTVNVLVSPQWVEIRNTLLVALAPYPEARVAAAAALEGRRG